MQTIYLRGIGRVPVKPARIHYTNKGWMVGGLFSKGDDKNGTNKKLEKGKAHGNS